MKKLIISCGLIFSTSLLANIRYICDVHFPCKYESEELLGECVKDTFFLTQYGKSLAGRISTLSEKRKNDYLVMIKNSSDTLDVFERSGEVSLELIKRTNLRYDGPMDYRGYVYTVTCDKFN